MMNSFLQDLSQIAKTDIKAAGSGNLAPFLSLYMKVHEIKTENNITYAYGLDMMQREIVRVRLNNIEEGANDLLLTKRASNLVEARNKITALYTGHNARETLDKKKTKRKSQYLYFERAVRLQDENAFMPTYRAHWSYSMTQQEDVEMVIGHINIKYSPAKQVGDRIDKQRAHARVIEFMRYFNLDNPESNLKMIEYALSNFNKGMIREGMFTAQIIDANGVIAYFNIFQKYAEVNAIDANGQNATFLAPQEPVDSVNHYLERETGPINQFTLTKDIARVVLHVFCGFDLDYSLFASDEPAYIGRLNELRDQLANGNYRVKVFGFKIYRFGPESITHLAPKNNFDPLKQYSKPILDENKQPTGSTEPHYIPTVLILHKTVNNRRYIAYHNRIHYHVLGEGKPVPLDTFGVESDPMPIKTTQLQML